MNVVPNVPLGTSATRGVNGVEMKTGLAGLEVGGVGPRDGTLPLGRVKEAERPPSIMSPLLTPSSTAKPPSRLLSATAAPLRHSSATMPPPESPPAEILPARWLSAATVLLRPAAKATSRSEGPWRLSCFCPARGGPNLMGVSVFFDLLLCAFVAFPDADADQFDPPFLDVDAAAAGTETEGFWRGATNFTTTSSFALLSSTVCTSNVSRFSEPARPANSWPSGRTLSRQSWIAAGSLD